MTRRVIIPESDKLSYDRLHFAPAVLAGNTLYCSGQIGTGSDGKLDSDPEARFAQAFENPKEVLSAAGGDFASIVELTTFHVGFNDVVAFMKVKDRYIAEPYPAWTAIGVSELAFGALVEVKATAVLE